MFDKPHPARRARVIVGAAGATSFLGLTAFVAASAESQATLELSSLISGGGAGGANLVAGQGAASETGLDLQGGALAAADAAAQSVEGHQLDGANPDVVEVMPAANVDPAAGVEVAPATQAQVVPAPTPASPAQSSTTATTTAAAAPAQTAAPATSPATTAPPATQAPATQAPAPTVTAAPTTAAPAATAPPTTAAPATAAPTTAAPATTAPVVTTSKGS